MERCLIAPDCNLLQAPSTLSEKTSWVNIETFDHDDAVRYELSAPFGLPKL